MSTSERLAKAVTAAGVYAPKPQASALLYGVIAVAILGIGLTVIGRFYSVNFLSFPISLAIGGAAAFAFGGLLRRKRAKKHRTAVNDELERDS